MHAILEGVAGTMLVAGALFSFVGGLGLLRLPDFFSRMHGAGITDTLGASLVLIGLMLHSGTNLATVKLAAVLFFLLITSPTSTHALAKSALAHGLRPRLGKTEDPPSHT